VLRQLNTVLLIYVTHGVSKESFGYVDEYAWWWRHGSVSDTARTARRPAALVGRVLAYRAGGRHPPGTDAQQCGTLAGGAIRSRWTYAD